MNSCDLEVRRDCVCVCVLARACVEDARLVRCWFVLYSYMQVMRYLNTVCCCYFPLSLLMLPDYSCAITITVTTSTISLDIASLVFY